MNLYTRIKKSLAPLLEKKPFDKEVDNTCQIKALVSLFSRGNVCLQFGHYVTQKDVNWRLKRLNDHK